MKDLHVWWDLRSYWRARDTVRSLSLRIPPRERWRRAYRIQRKIQRQVARRMFTGSIGCFYGVRFLRSTEVGG